MGGEEAELSSVSRGQAKAHEEHRRQKPQRPGWPTPSKPASWVDSSAGGGRMVTRTVAPHRPMWDSSGREASLHSYLIVIDSKSPLLSYFLLQNLWHAQGTHQMHRREN